MLVSAQRVYCRNRRSLTPDRDPPSSEQLPVGHDDHDGKGNYTASGSSLLNRECCSCSTLHVLLDVALAVIK